MDRCRKTADGNHRPDDKWEGMDYAGIRNQYAKSCRDCGEIIGLAQEGDVPKAKDTPRRKRWF